MKTTIYANSHTIDITCPICHTQNWWLFKMNPDLIIIKYLKRFEIKDRGKKWRNDNFKTITVDHFEMSTKNYLLFGGNNSMVGMIFSMKSTEFFICIQLL